MTAHTGAQRTRTHSARGRIATGVSILLIPPTVSAAVFGALAWEHPASTSTGTLLIWGTAVLFSGGLQMLYVLVLRSRSRVTAYDVPVRAQRTGPYLMSVALSLVGLLLLSELGAAAPLRLLMWCFAVNTLILTGINLVWKISAHLMGLTGPVVFLLPILGWWLLALLPVVLLLGWARVHLRSHTVTQVAAGAAAGPALVALQLFLISTYASSMPAFLR